MKAGETFARDNDVKEKMREKEKVYQSTRAMMKAFKNSLLFLSLALIACQGVQRTVAPEDRISLHAGGPHTGIWESTTIRLEYQYYKLSDEFKLSVQAKVKTEIRYDSIKVWVLFVDAEGRILERNEVGVYRLDNTFKMPPEVTYISFHANTYRRPVYHMSPHRGVK